MQTGKPFAIFQDRNDINWGMGGEENRKLIGSGYIPNSNSYSKFFCKSCLPQGI